MARIYNHEDGTFAVEQGVLLNGDDLTGMTEQYRSGYWVGLTNNVVLDEPQFDEVVEDLIEDGHKLVGIWYDEDKDVTYVDGVSHVGDLIEAIELGRKHKQECIWDIRRNCTIYI